jgi:hypothetical protein
MPGWHRIVLAVFLFSPLTVASARSDTAAVSAAAFTPFSVSPPTRDSVFICHGFTCKYVVQVDLTDADRAKLTQLLARGKASPEAERRAVAAAGAWFDRRIAPAAGTQNHVAHAGYVYMYNPHQFDCIDSSRNTTSLLLLLDQLGLLRHHTVDVPVSRGLWLGGQSPHTTAVLVETKSSTKWAVDSWTRGYGEAPEVMPLSRWVTLD